MAIQTLVFDFGNVLAFFDHWRTVRAISLFAEASPETIHRYLYRNDLQDEYERGVLTTAEVIELARRDLGLRCDDETFLRAFGDIFTANPAVLDWIPLLSRTHRLVLASNTNDGHYRFFRTAFADVLQHFSALVVSHEIGARKPTREFFARCHEHCDAPPQECLFLDDLAANVEAARAFGWQAEVYSPQRCVAEILASRGIPTSRS